MMPIDDPSWPACPDHNDEPWCLEVRDMFLANKDGVDIQPGMRYCVPIIPAELHFAEVSIDSDTLDSGIAPMNLVKTKGLYSSDEEFIYLGLWNPGEGRMVMSSMINDWLAGQEPGVCRQSTHGFAEEAVVRALIEQYDAGSVQWKVYHWCLAYHDACPPCYQRRLSSLSAVSASSYNASSFGLDPSSKDFRGPGARGSANTAAMDALRMRLQQNGNRWITSDLPL